MKKGFATTEFITHAGRFISVGLTSTALNYAAFLVLVNYLKLNYLMSSAIGYLLGLAFGFLLNNYWTFRAESISVRKLMLYCAVYLSSLGFSLTLLWVLVDNLNFDAVYMNFVAICCTTILNFLALKYLIYKTDGGKYV